MLSRVYTISSSPGWLRLGTGSVSGTLGHASLEACTREANQIGSNTAIAEQSERFGAALVEL
jgi:hypothetical protein